MKIPSGLKDARLNVRETAIMVGVHEAHFRRLVRGGVFPSAKRTAKGLPYFDHPLIEQIAGIVRSKVGANGVEVMFYRRRRNSAKRVQQRPQADAGSRDSYLGNLIEGLRQLGVDDARLGASGIRSVLVEEFGTSRPALERALPVVARRLLQADG